MKSESASSEHGLKRDAFQTTTVVLKRTITNKNPLWTCSQLVWTYFALWKILAYLIYHFKIPPLLIDVLRLPFAGRHRH